MDSIGTFVADICVVALQNDLSQEETSTLSIVRSNPLVHHYIDLFEPVLVVLWAGMNTPNNLS